MPPFDCLSKYDILKYRQTIAIPGRTDYESNFYKKYENRPKYVI